jgi:hypothetical protein
MMLAAGLDTEGLFSVRFRNHVLGLNQIEPPPTEFLFENWEHSRGISKRPPFLDAVNSKLHSVAPNKGTPLYQFARILDLAKVIALPGSAFMCLAMVIGSNAEEKIFVSNTRLLTDDPVAEWRNQLN